MHNAKVYKPQGAEKLVVESGGQVEVKSGGQVDIESGGEVEVKSGGQIDIESGGKLALGGTDIAAKLGKLTGLAVAAKTGADAANKVCLTNGVTLITGGTGIADMSLAAPSPGEVAIIRVASLTSGSVVVTSAAGVTLDGTNNTATFDAANEALMLVYSTANTWAIALNVGGVALSTVGE